MGHSIGRGSQPTPHRKCKLEPHHVVHLNASLFPSGLISTFPIPIYYFPFGLLLYIYITPPYHIALSDRGGLSRGGGKSQQHHPTPRPTKKPILLLRPSPDLRTGAKTYRGRTTQSARTHHSALFGRPDGLNPEVFREFAGGLDRRFPRLWGCEAVDIRP